MVKSAEITKYDIFTLQTDINNLVNTVGKMSSDGSEEENRKIHNDIVLPLIKKCKRFIKDNSNTMEEYFSNTESVKSFNISKGVYYE